MTPIDKLLVENEVVNPEIIKEIKESISVRYPSSTPKQKARLLAKAIHDLIEDALPDFSKDAKVNVRTELLKKNLSSNSLTINANDIVETSIELIELDEVKEKLHQWLEHTVAIEDESFEKYISSKISTKEIDTVQHENVVPIHSKIKRKYIAASVFALLIFIPIAIISAQQLIGQNVNYANVETKTASELRPANELPEHLQYKSIDEKKLRAWLEARDSMLAGEPYFSTIIEVADEFNIHPLLLFAITGQEQGFVPKSKKHAVKVANNPYNVFHSWKEYNTNILDSTQIAARTITNLSKDRPEDVHPIKWINRKYAEDQNWWKGVSSIFDKLENDIQRN